MRVYYESNQGRTTMKSQIRVGVALLTGIAVGAAAVQALHAQVKPPGYLIADVTVTDEEGYKEYVQCLSENKLNPVNHL